MRYTIHSHDNLSKSFTDIDSLISYAKEKKFKHLGENNSRSTRIELKGQPVFQGLCGPMWDGENEIRYETPELYEMLST